MSMGGSGGGSSKFSAQGAPPGFDYGTAMGLQQLAIGGDIQSYALSDLDFANRYPALQDAYNQYQAMIGQQIPSAATGAAGMGQIMQGLGGQILGRQGTGTTQDINALRAQAGAAASAAQPMFNLGATQAGLAQPIAQMGQQQAGIGGVINQMGGQLGRAAQIPFQVGQQLLQEPVDPITQQQMMRAGLTGAAGSMGAASLGQGMAGQAAAARQLGLSTLQYGQAMRGEGMQDINQYASMLGAAGQMRGLGAQTIGAGAGTIGLGGQQLSQAGQLYGQGANVATQAGGLYGSAQNLQEQMAMNTAQMAGIYGGLQNQQSQQLLGNIANANQMFQKRPFGLGGTNLAQTELGQTSAYNSFQQANYATMNGIAFNQAQMAAQQQQLQAQQSAGMMSAGVGVATTAASVAALTCYLARAAYGIDDPRWRYFRSWLYTKAPWWLRALYIRHAKSLAEIIIRRRMKWLLSLIRMAMNRAIYDRCYIAHAFGIGTFQLIFK